MTQHDHDLWRVTYKVENTSNLEERGKKIAIGLTIGSWTGLPAIEQERMKPYLGKVLEAKDNGELTIGYPAHNFTPDIPALLTSVFGKLSMDDGIRLVDIEMPESVKKHFPGPRFGIEGIRKLLHIECRPLLMSIFKSCIGYPLEKLKEEYWQQISGGVDLVKDDEIFFSEELVTAEKRVKAFSQLNKKWYEESGRKVLYAVNLTGPVTTLLDKAYRLQEAGAQAFLINVLVYGWDFVHRLVENPNIQVPIMSHPALAGAFYQSSNSGIAASLLLGKLMRWIGSDLVLFPSPYGSVALAHEEALKIAYHLRQEDERMKPSLPVPSAGIHPGMVPKIIEDFGYEVVINAGGGIHGHPMGASAGAKAFRDAITAALAGRPLTDAAQESKELATSLYLWGGK
jgi:2,3-diketo-5-methylthiopentyl-1-phosphate enolase